MIEPSQLEAERARLQEAERRQRILSDEMLRAGMQSEEAHRLLKEPGLASAVVAPLFDGNQPLGSVILASAGAAGRRYTQNDIDFAVGLADRASLAVRNARLVRDLASERDRQLAARREAECRAAELFAVFRADPNGIVLFDPQDRMQLYSSRMEEVFGGPMDHLVGRHFSELVAMSGRPDDSAGAAEARLREIFAARDAPSRDELQLPRGDRWVSRTSAPVRSPADDYLGRLFVYVDITARKLLDQSGTGRAWSKCWSTCCRTRSSTARRAGRWWSRSARRAGRR